MEDRVMFDAAVDPTLDAAMAEADAEQALVPATESEPTAMPLSSDGMQQTPTQARRELVIVDSTVENYQQLVDDIIGNEDPLRDIDVVTIDGSVDGVQAISDILANYSSLDTVHLVSHGTDAALQLGDVWLSTDNLTGYAGQIAQWSSAFGSEGDLLLYGCHLGESVDGRELIESISTLTETDVAASTDDTGYAPRGGNWELEYSVGSIESSIAFSQQLQASWTGLLAVGPSVTISTPGNVPLGEDVNFSVTFDNTGMPGDVGFGPYIDILLPTLGTDGVYDDNAYTETPDGLDIAASGAITYLGQDVNYQVLTFGDADGAFNDNGTPGDLSDDTGTGTLGVITHPFFEAIQNESQLLSLSGGVTGGSYTLEFDGQTTSALAHDASAATIQAALEGLTNIDPGDISVTTAADGNQLIEFTGALAEADVAELIVDDTNLVGGYLNVYTLVNGDSVAQALSVYGNAGDKLVVVELPFGSFTPEQPTATLNINASMSNLADLTVPLNINTRGGFRFGATATDDPDTDPSIVSDSQQGASSWAVTGSVTPTLLDLSKTSNAPEGETATGPSYVRQWSVRVNIPDGQTITNLDIFDDLPDNVVFVSLDSITSVDGTTTFTTNVPIGANGTAHTGSNGQTQVDTTAPQASQSLIVTADSITGTTSNSDVVVTFSYYVEETDAAGDRVIPVNGEDDTTSSPDSRSHNNARAVGDWTPTDTRDAGGTDNATADPPGDESTVDDKAIATQKSVTVVDSMGTPVGGDGHPGEILRYTINFQISDYYTFGDLVLTDVFSDGQQFYTAAGFEPIFNVSDFNATHTGELFSVHVGAENSAPGAPGSANFIVDRSDIDNTDNADELGDGTLSGGGVDPTSGTTTITMELSEALALLSGEDGILQGGLTNGASNLGAATGTITFYTQIQDEFSDSFASGDRSVDQGDTLTNNVTIAGSVRQNEEDNGTTFSTLGNEDDNSSASISIEQGELTKSIYAINGVTGVGGNVEVAPGDEVTYRLTYTLPTSDFEQLVLTDFFPLPVFTVNDPDADDVAGPAWSFDADASSDSFTGGSVEILSTDTFYDLWDQADDGMLNDSVAPTLTTDAAANSLTIDYGSFDNPAFQSSQIDLLLTVTVQDDPFADGLFLTNTALATENSTSGDASTQVDLIQIQLTQPVVAEIEKGIVDTSETTGFTATDNGNTVTFSEIGTAASFSGTVNSDFLSSVPLETLVADLDAGDTVRFAVVVENIGSSRKGAFDVTIADVLPPGFNYVDDSLQIYDGTGATLTYAGTDNDLFASGITLDDPGATAGQADGTDSGSLDEFNATSGRNVAVIIYDVTIDTSVQPTEQVDNTARLLGYAGTEGGESHIVTPQEAIASVTITEPTFVATLEGTSIDTGDGSGNNEANEVVIGELVQYKLTVTLPEGTINAAEFFDRLDNGLEFVQIDSIAASAGVSSSIGDLNDPGDISLFNPTISNGIRDLTFDLGTITNANTDNAQADTIELTYSARVRNIGSNQSTALEMGPNRNNNAHFQYDTDGMAGADEQTVSSQASTVSIIEPIVDIDKNVVSVDDDAGNELVYTIIIDHNTNSEADAFDLTFFDDVPLEIEFDFTTTTVTHTTDLLIKDRFEVVGNRIQTIAGQSFDLDVGETVIITINGTIAADVSAGQTISNRADIDWTSLDGVQTGERTGADGQNGALDDYATYDVATFTTALPEIAKELVSTSIDNSGTTGTNTNSEAVIGETAVYRVTLTVPEGEIDASKIIDDLEQGLQFVSLDSITASVNVTSNTVDLNDASTVTPTTDGDDGITAAQTVIFDLGTITNSNNTNSAAETIVLEYTVRVVNSTTVGTDTGEDASLVNAAYFQWDLGNPELETIDPASAAAIAVIEPDLDIDKQVVVVGSGTTGDAGDTVAYTITIDHAATSTDAYDVVFTDALTNDIIYDISDVTAVITHADMSTTDVIGLFEVLADGTLQTKASPQQSFDLLEGESLQITVNGVIAGTVSPNESIGNAATINWTSLNDDEISGSATSVERDGESGVATAPNDYRAASSADVTILPPTFVKSLFATDQTETSGSEVTIGETITYALLIELPEGSTAGLDVVDLLPDGLDYTGYTLVTTAADSGGLLTADFNGTVANPTVTGGTGDGVDVTFDFGAITVANDNDATNDSFLILFDAIVLDVASNVGFGMGQTTLANSATIDVDGDGVGPQSSGPVNVLVVEPEITIETEFGPTVDVDRADAGDTVTVVLTVQNTGESSAYDVIVADTLDGTKFDLTSLSSGVAGTAYPNDFTVTYDNMTGALSYSGGTLAEGSTTTFTFTIDLLETVDPGETITTTANVTQATTLSGAETGERDAPVTPDSDTVTIYSNSLAGFVYSDANNNGTFDTPTESGINDADQRVTLTGTDHLGNMVNQTIAVNADGSYLFDNLRASDATGYTITQSVAPANFVDGKDTVGTQGGTLGNDSISQIVLAENTEVAGTGNNFGETEPATVGNFVWYDIDGDGVQDMDEPGLPSINLQLLAAGQDGLFGTADDLTFNTTTDANGAYSVDTLPAGLYRVSVLNAPTGTTQTAETDDGANNISGVAEINVAPGATRNDIDFGYQGNGSIGNTVFWDADGDGIQDAGEAALPNVAVRLNIDFDQNGSVDHFIDTTTDANGLYLFDNLPVADYTVVVTPPASSVQTFDADGLGTANQSSLTLTANEDNTDQNFGYRGTGVISDVVFWDTNNNNMLDGADRGLGGVDVTITIDVNDSETYTATVQTNDDGTFTFNNLIAGDYEISVDPSTVPGGMGVNPTFDSNGTGTANVTSVTLAAGETADGHDFGYTGTASLGDRVWLDTDNDGIQDATNEPGLANVDLTITWYGADDMFGTADDQAFTLTTADDGSYDLTNLAAGTYLVDVDQSTAPATSTLTTSNDTHEVTLAAGTDHNTSDFGFRGNSSISDTLFFDQNDNGVQDGDEGGYPGIVITIVGDIDGDGLDETFIVETDDNGDFTMPGLPEGTYTVTYTQPTGTTPGQDSGGNPTTNQSTVVVDNANPNGTPDFAGVTGSGSVGETIFYDLNGNGTQDGDDPGIVGVTVRIDVDLDGDNVSDFNTTTTTDADGNYTFENIPAGMHTITVTPPAGTNPTSDLDGMGGGDNSHTFTLAAGEDNTAENFGYLGTGSIGDTIYWDVNNNGVQDAGEVGLFNVPVRLNIDFDSDGNTDYFLDTTTDIDGNYSFDNLPAGQYEVIVTQPTGTTQTDDPDATLNNRTALTLAADANEDTLDFGYRGNSTLSNFVFWDVDNSSDFDAAVDQGIAGVDVTLEIDFDGDMTADYTTTIQTDADGNYTFDNLLPGDYTITVDDTTIPGDLSDTPTVDGDGIGTPHTSDVTLAADTTNNDHDFGYTGTGSLASSVFWDANNNAARDVGEPGLPDVALTLEVDADEDGNVDFTLDVETDANGRFSFANLPSGDYVLTATQPDGTTQTFDTNGLGTANETSVTLATGETGAEQVFGYRGNGSIGDIVFFDYVGDGGIYDPTENDRGLAGVDVTLAIDVNGDATTDYTVTATTDSDGNFTFDNLIAGTYTITTDPTDLPDDLGDNPTYDADGVAAGSKHTTTVVLAADETTSAIDFGYHATPDYNITKDDGLLNVTAGQTVSYTITLRNDGTLFGQNVVVTDTFPANVLENVMATGGGTVDQATGTIVWNAATTPSLATLDVGEEIEFTVTGQVVGILDGSNDSLATSVTVTDDLFNGIDPNPADNTDGDIDQVVDLSTLTNVTNLVPNGDNWEITFEVIIENTGSVDLNDLTLADDLASQFGPAFVSVTNPMLDTSGLNAGGTAPQLNPNWSTDTSLDLFDPAFMGEELRPGEQLVLSYTVTIDPDAAGTSSALTHQATAGGTDTTTDPANPLTVSDASDSGSDPTTTNPGAPGDTGGEDDATPLYIPDIAVAQLQGTPMQDATTHNYFVEYTLFVENIGTVSLESLSLTEDIAAELGNAFVGIDPGSLTLQNYAGSGTAPSVNAAWEGDTSLDLLDPTGTQLDAGDSFEITFTVEIDPDGVDGLSQTNQTQATASGRGLDENNLPLLDDASDPIVVTDLSDSGSDPGGINPLAAGDTGTSDDPALLVIPEIGAAKRLVEANPTATGGNRDITYEIVIRNLGTVELENITLTEDLGTQFGDALIGIAAGGEPTIMASTASETPTLNTSWDGNLDNMGDAEIFLGTDGLLLPGEELTIRFTVEVDIDQFTDSSANQVETSGSYDATPGRAGHEGIVSDLSDTGTDPAGNNPDAVGDTGGFDDPTIIPAIGIAAQHGDFVADGENFIVPITLTIENIGATPLTDLVLWEDLQSQFGDTLLDISTPTIDNSSLATPANGPGINADWQNDTSLNLLDGSGTLVPGDVVIVTFNVTIDPDISGESLSLENQAEVIAADPNNASAVVQDLSDSGTDPNLNNPGEPGDSGTSDDPTPLQIPDVGIVSQVINDRQLGLEHELTIEITLENTGTTDLNNLQLLDDVAAQYGENYGQIVQSPTIVASTATTDPTINPGYDADTTQNMFDGTSGLLKPGESITIQLIVEVTAVPGQSEATLINQAQGGGTALDVSGAPLTDLAGNPLAATLDLSDSGDDPNGNNPGAPGDTGGTADATSIDVTFFTFDAYNDFSNLGQGLWSEPEGEQQSDMTNRILSQQISSLAPEPIFSGSARPGTQIIGRVFNSSGIMIGEEVSFSDVGGNWMMQFHDLASLDHARFEFVEIAGTGNQFAPTSDPFGYLGHDSTENNYAVLENWTSYNQQYDFTAVHRQMASNVLASMHRMNERPLGFGTAI